MIFTRLLYEKRKELCDARDKLSNGLGKIEEAKVQVTQMSIELEKKRALANEAQKKCEESLGGLVNEQREVEQSKATVEKLKERVKIDEEKASTIAQAAQEDLAAAMPALEAANLALESLSKSSITEVKSYGRPPAPVEKALEAVMILRNSEPTWAEAKRQLGMSITCKEQENKCTRDVHHGCKLTATVAPPWTSLLYPTLEHSN